MNKKLKAVTFALLVLFTLSAVVGTPFFGPFGVDVVSAATTASGATPAAPAAPAAPKAPVAPKAPAASAVSTNVARLLAEGSVGNDVALLQTMLNDNGFKLKVDGIFGTLTLNAVKSYQSKNGLKADGIVGPRTLAKLNATVTAPAEPTAPVASTTVLKIGRADLDAHGTKCFTNAVVALAGDKIVAATLDDYQTGDPAAYVGVPNSYKDFGNGVVGGNVVYSKMANAATYSANMAARGGSTVPVDKNFAFIEAYVVGKTVAELESVLAANTPEQMVDVVSGATLVDTHGYVSAIVAAAKAAKENSAFVVATSDLANLKIGRADLDAHGTKCFTNAVAVMVGNKIVAATLDDYQIGDPAAYVGVPNSDKDFGKAFGSKVLYSKLVNAAAYSKNMAERGGSTVPVDKNFAYVEAYVAGKTIAELESVLAANTPEQMVDVVSGATLADTHGYVSAIVAAAKATQPKTEVDVVSGPTQVVITNEASLLNGISKKGAWIVIFEKDHTTTKELVLDGQFKNNRDAIQRKLALYTQDDKKVVLERFTLTAPKLTIKSENARIQGGTFAGDVYVEANGFNIVNGKVDGNIYFANEEFKSTFTLGADAEVTGVVEVLEAK